MLKGPEQLVFGRLTTIFLALTVACGAHADDWPQWRGLHRDGKSNETGLLKCWPEGGPPLVWKATGAGAGYSSLTVSDGRVLTMGDVGDGQLVIAFAAKTGEPLWQSRNGSAFANDRGGGARSTPTVDGAFVYALGTHGDVSCHQVEDGTLVWTVNVRERFGGSNISWGLSESVLIEDDKLICSPGGPDAGIVALDKRTGETVWSSKGHSDKAGHASAVAATIAGVRQIVHLTGAAAVGLRASDGQPLWRNRSAANGTANCTTPVVYGGGVYYTSGYGAGCALMRITAEDDKVEAHEVYFNKVMKNHHGGVVLVNGCIYGSSNQFVCMELVSGQRRWRVPGPGKCSVIHADGHLYCLSVNGVMALVEANPDSYVEKSRFVYKQYENFKTGGLGPADEKPTWSHPVIANGKLLLRDQDTIHCYDINAR